MYETQIKACALCQSPLTYHLYKDDKQLFCCAGCQAVYQILASQDRLDQATKHPLFQQALKSGLISNPYLMEQVSHNQNGELPEQEWMKLHVEIQEMWCPSCAKIIHLMLIKEKGVRQCLVDYSTDLASIEYTPRYISKEKIFRLIEQLGYRPLCLEDKQQKPIHHSLYLRFIIAAFFSANIMMFAYPIYSSYFHADSVGYASLFAWISLLGSLPVLFYSAWPIWRRLYTGLRLGIWGMEMLVFMGVAAAMGLSLYELRQGSYYVYFDSMTVIILFVLLGKIIESRAKFSAKDSLLRLTRSLPRRGRKQLADGSECFVPLKEISPGDRLIVLTGEKIVLDGVVEAGEGTCDESIMTGESLPLIKQKGALVLAGSLLQQGRLMIKVTANSENTALHRIIEMIEQEIGYKSQYVRAADYLVKWFVPLVVILAIGTALYCGLYQIMDRDYTVLQTAFIRAISILLISCPCAIGVAAPLAEAHLLNALAKLGAIVRNRGCLAFLGRETTIIFDKTGTVTEGTFKVLKGYENLSLDHQMCVKGLVSHSNHPIAVALYQFFLVPVAPFQQVEEIIGRGIKGLYKQDVYYLGSAEWLRQQAIEPLQPLDLEEDRGTHVFFAKNQTCLAYFTLGDRLRPDMIAFIRFLSANLKTLLVSGDAPSAVKRVAVECGFTDWRAGYHPLQKRKMVEELREKGEIVLMIGDGINDAPALAAAHVGMAVVSATDISIQVSDILLTTDRLMVFLRLREIALKGKKIVKQNIFWAFFYNVMGIGLAMNGILSPIFAAFAMVASSLMILLNTRRIR